jgi:hypothetical protein
MPRLTESMLAARRMLLEPILHEVEHIQSTRARAVLKKDHHLPLVQAALLPLLRHEADIVQVVLKHYQWAVLVDTVCDLEQQYVQMISKAEDGLSGLVEVSRAAWSIYGPIRNDKDMYGFDMSGTMEERDAFSSESDCAMHCHKTAVKLYVLKQDVAKCQKFEHTDTARSVRKTEGAKIAHRLKKLLSSIDGSFKTWLRNKGRFGY